MIVFIDLIMIDDKRPSRSGLGEFHWNDNRNTDPNLLLPECENECRIAVDLWLLSRDGLRYTE
jgi:hypothetical protein